MLSAQQIRVLESRERVTAFATKAALQGRFDANETLFLERQLTQIRQAQYVQYAELFARTLMPMATDVAPFADTYVYPVYDRKGRARLGGNNPTDLPRIDLVAFEVTGKVRNIEAAYGWDINTMSEAARLGIDLPGAKADATAAAINLSIDEVLSLGDLTTSTGQSNVGCSGFINNADVISQGIIAPTTAQLSSASGAQMAADLNQLANTVVNGSNQRWIPDTIALAPNEYNLAATTPLNTVSDTTVLKWFLNNTPYIKNVVQWYRLTGAGASNKNRAVVYKKDKLVLEGVVPLEFQQLPPQPTNLEFLVPCMARCGGVKVYQPSAMRYADFTP